MTNDRSDGPRSGRHDNGFPRLWLAALQQAEIGGQASDSIHAEQVGLRLEIRQAREVLARKYGVFLPTGVGEHQVARLQVRHVGRHHFRQPATGHDLTRVQRGTVRRALHPGAVSRIERDIAALQQDLALPCRWTFRDVQSEVVRGQPVALGKAVEHDLSVGHGIIPVCFGDIVIWRSKPPVAPSRRLPGRRKTG